MIRFKPLPALTIVSLIAILFLIALGKWQLDRLHWKLDLIAAAELRAHATPVAVEDLAAKAPKDIEYAHAFAQGEFLNEREVYIFSQLDGNRIGFEVLTPFRLGDGRLLLVDRGFVPSELKDPARRIASQIEGPVRVSGLVRAAQRPTLFTAAPDLEAKVWYARDIDAIAAAENLDKVLPFVLAADATALPGGYPEGGHTRLAFSNNHLEYALTWFSLACVLLVIYLAYHVKRGRLRVLSRG